MYLHKFIAIVAVITLLCGCSSAGVHSMSSIESSLVADRAIPIVNKIGGSRLLLERYTYRITVGETSKIVVDTLPSGFQAGDLMFLSDNTRAVHVKSDGTMVGIQNGAATIAVSVAGTSVRATVTVIVTNK